MIVLIFCLVLKLADDTYLDHPNQSQKVKSSTGSQRIGTYYHKYSSRRYLLICVVLFLQKSIVESIVVGQLTLAKKRMLFLFFLVLL